MAQKVRRSGLFTRLVTLGLSVLLFSALPVRAAEGGGCGENLQWSLSGGVLTLTGSGAMTDFADNTFAPWYDRREEITALVLPSGLTSIGALAFYDCVNLKTAAVPASVTAIGGYAFARCAGVLTVDLPSGLTSIGGSAFQECGALSAIRLPDTLTSIGDQAFYRCDGLTAVTVPASVTKMGRQVFAYCGNLVQATVNAPLSVLPNWTFYGCGSLSSLSLAPSITSVGEYALEQCGSLDAVYTKSYDGNTANQIQQSMGTAPGYVAAYDPPASTVSSTEDGETAAATKVTESENAVIAVKDKTTFSGAVEETSTAISAVVENSDGWSELAGTVAETLGRAQTDGAAVDVQLTGSTVKAEELSQFAGQNVTLNVTTDTGAVWQIDMSNAAGDDFSGSYELDAAALPVSADSAAIKSDALYKLSFAGKTDFNTTVSVALGPAAARQAATLFQKSGREYEPVQTVLVDGGGNAWFSLAGVDGRTDYFIALNAEGVPAEDAVVPKALYSDYGVDGEALSLMDESGVRYEVTGRTSSWGITGQRFAVYVAVAVGALILIVAAVMITLNKLKQFRLRYAVREEEAPIDEEALRMEVMREMLEETEKKGK